MKHITIVVPCGAALSNIELPRQVFTEVNDYLVSTGKDPLFKIQIAGMSKAISLNEGLFLIQSTVTIFDIQKTDLIIIPATFGDMKESLENNRKLINWIVLQYHAGAEIASLCMGSFLLAGTGLLNGRKCATHWKGADHFRDMFPEVDLVKEKIITDEMGIYSSGGGISFLNLIIYLVEKYAGRETAIYCSKFFQVDLARSSQSPFIMFQGQKDHDDEPVKKAQEYIEHNVQEKITAGGLSVMLSLGRRSLERRFKKATSNTLNEYIQRVRIESAKKQLEISSRKVNDIMYEVGYSDVKAFRRSFKTVTGLQPNAYRKKYNLNMVE